MLVVLVQEVKARAKRHNIYNVSARVSGGFFRKKSCNAKINMMKVVLPECDMLLFLWSDFNFQHMR